MSPYAMPPPYNALQPSPLLPLQLEWSTPIKVITAEQWKRVKNWGVKKKKKKAHSIQTGPEGAGIGHPTATASFTSPPLFALKDFLKSFFGSLQAACLGWGYGSRGSSRPREKAPRTDSCKSVHPGQVCVCVFLFSHGLCGSTGDAWDTKALHCLRGDTMSLQSGTGGTEVC